MLIPNFPLRRKQHSGADGVEGDQGDWTGMGMERMKLPGRGTSSGRLRTVTLRARAAACGCLPVFHYKGA